MTDPYLDDLEFANKANIEAARKFKAERDALVKALKSLTNEMFGIWDAFEYGLRHEISNTNYAVAREKLVEAERVLALVGCALRDGS